MKSKILNKLKEIETEHKVEILLAMESGSRAWGFASQDSDWDVRFLYKHEMSWYLDVLKRRDVIEYPIVDDLDYNGWDLRKMFNLLSKSNPVLFEWFQSPIVYYEKEGFREYLKEPLNKYFSPVSTIYHYLHMAENNYRQYLKEKEVKIKKYFYVLRPLLACSYIEKYRKAPPIEFDILVNEYRPGPDLLHVIEDLLQKKKEGKELGLQPRIDILNQFIETLLEHFTSQVKDYDPAVRPGAEYINEKFAHYVLGKNP